jgi:hypothetical protein
MATEKQYKYAMILFNDNGIDTSVKRKDWIQLRFPGKSNIDDLTTKECSELIKELIGDDE